MLIEFHVTHMHVFNVRAWCFLPRTHTSSGVNCVNESETSVSVMRDLYVRMDSIHPAGLC